jgi:hypothetical protein
MRCATVKVRSLSQCFQPHRGGHLEYLSWTLSPARMEENPPSYFHSLWSIGSVRDHSIGSLWRGDAKLTIISAAPEILPQSPLR